MRPPTEGEADTMVVPVGGPTPAHAGRVSGARLTTSGGDRFGNAWPIQEVTERAPGR